MSRLRLAPVAFICSLSLACGGGETLEQPIEGTETLGPSHATGASDYEVEICPSWEEGETRQLEIIEAKRGTGDADHLSGDSRGRTPVNVRVTEANDSGYVFEWTLGKAEIEKFEVGGRELSEEEVQLALETSGANLFVGLPLEFETDQCGGHPGLRNVSELAATMNELVDRLLDIQEATDGPMSPADRARIRAQLTSREFIEATLGQYGIYYDANGLSISQGRQVSYDDVLANPLGGPPFPVSVAYALREPEQSSACTRIGRDYVFDPDEFADILVETGARFAPPGVTPNEANVPLLEIVDEADFEFCNSTSWPVAVKHRRTSMIDGLLREDTLEIVDGGS